MRIERCVRWSGSLGFRYSLEIYNAGYSYYLCVNTCKDNSEKGLLVFYREDYGVFDRVSNVGYIHHNLSVTCGKFPDSTRDFLADARYQIVRDYIRERWGAWERKSQSN